MLMISGLDLICSDSYQEELRKTTNKVFNFTARNSEGRNVNQGHETHQPMSSWTWYRNKLCSLTALPKMRCINIIRHFKDILIGAYSNLRLMMSALSLGKQDFRLGILGDSLEKLCEFSKPRFWTDKSQKWAKFQQTYYTLIAKIYIRKQRC